MTSVLLPLPTIYLFIGIQREIRFLMVSEETAKNE